MRGAAIVALLATSGLAASCGDSDVAEWPSPTWAEEVDVVAAAMTEAYDVEDAYQTARFFSAGGTLDLSIWRLGVLTTPDGVVDGVERLWHQQPGLADVRAEQVFVTPDGAIIWWSAMARDGFQHWVQTYVFGAGGRITSSAYRAIDVPFVRLDTGREILVEFVDRYLDAWAGNLELGSVYADDVIVRDRIAGTEWHGIDELAEERSNGPRVERGPWPTMFQYLVGERHEAVVLVQLEGECPMLEARRLIFVDGVVGWETRYTHVPSAQRCLDGLDDPEGPADGWWTMFELPADLQENVTGVIDTGGAAVELVNAEPNQRDYARWLVDRFVESGLGPPPLAAMWFPPSLDCDTVTGLAIADDERYDGRHTIVLCTSAAKLESADSESGWILPAVSVGLHELAHHWMRDVLDDATRDAFNARVGLDAWRDTPEPRERGVEHAAYTIAWGLAGDEDARYAFLPVPECDELAARFELLTGRKPVTACGAEGWSQ